TGGGGGGAGADRGTHGGGGGRSREPRRRVDSSGERGELPSLTAVYDSSRPRRGAAGPARAGSTGPLCPGRRARDGNGGSPAGGARRAGPPSHSRRGCGTRPAAEASAAAPGPRGAFSHSVLAGRTGLRRRSGPGFRSGGYRQKSGAPSR